MKAFSPDAKARLDAAILHFLKHSNGHPTNSTALEDLAGGKWRRIDSRMQVLKKAGRIQLHRGPKSAWPEGVKDHGWEVLK